MEEWLANNNLYLEASLQWLRLRLQKLAPQEIPVPVAPTPPVNPTTSTNPTRSRFSKWINATAPPEKTIRLLPQGQPPTIEEQIEEAAEKREAAAQMDPPPALLLLAKRFGLSTFERDTLLLCAALEFDPSLAHLLALAQGQSKDFPTFSLALNLFDEPRWDATSAHRPLRCARLLEISQPGAMPLTSSALRADERVVPEISPNPLADAVQVHDGHHDALPPASTR